MYEFVDLNKPAKNNQNNLKTIVNGINLDDTYDIQTLNVTGRGLIAPVNTMTEKVGTDGSWLDSSYYPARPIIVELLVNFRADNIRYMFEKLNSEIGTSLVSLVFTDDLNWKWHAVLNEVLQEKEDSYSQIIELVFLCPDPFKYEIRTRSTGKGTVNPRLMYLTKPELIEFTVGEETEAIRITNITNGQNIVLKDDFVKGDRIAFDYSNNSIRKIGGGSLLTKLDILSDFEDFSFSGGNQIEVSPAGSDITITYRERSL